MGLLWGAHAVPIKDIGSFEEMIAKGKRMALRHGISHAGAKLVMMAGVPFGPPGSTNVLHVATLTGAELNGHSWSDSNRDKSSRTIHKICNLAVLAMGGESGRERGR